MAEKPYPQAPYVIKRDHTVLQCGRLRDKVVEVPRALPANVILVHGVNDVGMGYAAAEEGLCAGLQERLSRCFKPAGYTLPARADRNDVKDDPDAVFFKRKATPDADSPVIPFYWGYRETKANARFSNGQNTDRYGTRLDKDLSKGGGPFANATSTLPDLWNKGIGVPLDPIGDPLRPIKDGPGRMYMVLAACRLAALVSMIRKFAPDDTVNIVAHSQGGLLALLAQAILMDRGERTADTLILTHPPYSLDEEMGLVMKTFTGTGGTDPAMEQAHQYGLIDGRQTLQARLQTLVNIVAGIAASRHAEPAFARINECDCGGMVASCWEPDHDRDNRGKVYLYFCPEDMTVALDSVRGIGWQGVPDYAAGTRPDPRAHADHLPGHGALARAPHGRMPGTTVRRPLAELGAHFFQRVFTARRRPDPRTGKPHGVLVGQAPHDFPLRIAGEDDHAHVGAGVRSLRDRLPLARWPIEPSDPPEAQRQGIRRISGEALAHPCEADLRGKQVDANAIPASSHLAKAAPKDRGPCDEVDPITAAGAVAAGELRVGVEPVPDPLGKTTYPGSPQPLPDIERRRLEIAYNKANNPGGTTPDNKYRIVQAIRYPDGVVKAHVQESWNDARRRWQHELGEKSFHSAIFENAANHRQVTSYDLSIGGGRASSHPDFHAYLCAVADWRLKKPSPNDPIRFGILLWADFTDIHGNYYECESEWHKLLFEGNCDYYSWGTLPKCLPLLDGKLWNVIVSETASGKRIDPTHIRKGQS